MCVALLLASLSTAQSYAQEPLLTRDQAKQEKTLEFKLENGAKDKTFAIFLHVPAKAITAVSTELILRAGGEVLNEVTLSPALSDQSLDQIAAGQHVMLHLQAKGLERVGEFNGEAIIRFSRDNVKSTLVFPIKLTREGAPTLAIVKDASASSIKWTTSAPSASFSITLRETSGDASAKIKVEVGELTRGDGVASPGASLTIAKKEYELAKHGHQVLTLNAKLPEAATYRSWIMISDGISSPTFQNLEISRTAPRFEIPGADATKGLAFVVGRREIKRTISVRLAENQPAVSDLKVEVGDLQRDGGQPAEDGAQTAATLEIEPLKPQPLQTGGRATFTLIAKNLTPGKYTSEITLSSQGQTQVIPLLLDRQAIAQNIKVEDIGNGSGTVFLLGFGASPTLRVTVSETKGHDAIIYHPVVESLKRVSSDTLSVELPPREISFRRRVKGRMLPVVLNEPADRLVHLPPRGVQSYGVRISQLGPGKYEGRLAVSGPDIERQQKSFEVYVRHAWYWAFTVILIGVAGSYFLHYFKHIRRQQMLNLANVAKTREAIEQDEKEWPESGENSVWPFLLLRLRDIRDELNITPSIAKATVDAQLNDVKARRGLNIEGLSLLKRIHVILDGYPPELERVRDEFYARVKTQRDLLRLALRKRDGKGLGDDEAPKAITELNRLIERAVKAVIVEPADALLKECQRLSELRGKDPVLTEIEASVEKIVTAADDGVAGLANDLQQAYERFGKWQRSLLTESAKRLQSIRKAATGGSWQDFSRAMDQLKEALDDLDDTPPGSTRKLELFTRARRRLDLCLIEQIRGLATVDPPTDIESELWNEAQEQSQVLKRVAEAREAHLDGKTVDALDAYNRAREAYANMQIKVLNDRIDALKALVRKTPSKANEDAWDEQLSAEKFKSAVNALRTLTVDDNASIANKEELLAKARANLLGQRIEVLTQAGAAAQAVLPEDMKGDQASFEEALEQARTEQSRFLRLDNDLRQGGLHKADQAGVVAQRVYAAIVEEEPLQAMGLNEAKIREGETNVVGGFGGLVGMPPVSNLSPLTEISRVAAAAEGEQTSAEIIATIQTYDNYVFWLTILIATMGGVLGLWATNYAWGSITDYFAALLWGFGLNEAGTAIISNLKTQGHWPKEG